MKMEKGRLARRGSLLRVKGVRELHSVVGQE